MDNAFIIEKCKTDLEFANEYIQSLLKENEELRAKNEDLSTRMKKINGIVMFLKEQYCQSQTNNIYYSIRQESESNSIFDKITDFIF